MVGAIGEIAPTKTYENNFNHHNTVQFEQHLRCKAILSSTVLSQQGCEVQYPPLT